MCGLIGVYYKNPDKRVSKEAIQDLVYVNQLRGMHSAGVIYSYTKDKQLYIGHDKAAGLPWAFVKDNKSVINQIDNKSNKLLAFHGRRATRGAVTKENAHPFNTGNITLMHNGTLRNEYNINKKYFDVDSKAIAHYLAQEDATEQGLIDVVVGAYALVWTDLADGSLHFLRNDERPLWFAENDDYIMWASEKAFISFVSTRHNLKFGKVEELNEYTHRIINMKTNADTSVTLTPPPKKTFSYMDTYAMAWQDVSVSSMYNTTEKKVVPLHDKKSVQFPTMITSDKTLSAYHTAMSSLIFEGSFNYRETPVGLITTNPKLPSKEHADDLFWDVISFEDKLATPFWNDKLEPNQTMLFSVHNTRIFESDHTKVQTQLLHPVDYPEYDDYIFMGEVPRFSFAVARRNNLLLSGKIEKIVPQDGDKTLVIVGVTTYVHLLDPLYANDGKAVELGDCLDNITTMGNC